MAEYVELFLDQGTDQNFTITLTDDTTGNAVNLQGYSANSQMRTSYVTANAAAIFTVTFTDIPNGNVTLSMNASTTSNIPAGKYLFDLKLISPANTVTRPIEGIVIVTPSISK